MHRKIILCAILITASIHAFAADSSSLTEETVNSDLSSLNGNAGWRDTPESFPAKWAGGVGAAASGTGTNAHTNKISGIKFSADGKSGTITGVTSTFYQYPSTLTFSYNGSYGYSVNSGGVGGVSMLVTSSGVTLGFASYNQTVSMKSSWAK